mmetsp:Transcript_1150/g.4449  ORF Transcript_1150/g.4449 Transcript_1150/m.4449 type:complete len:363 (+) Transcript_1150:2307-3395(+)
MAADEVLGRASRGCGGDVVPRPDVLVKVRAPQPLQQRPGHLERHGVAHRHVRVRRSLVTRGQARALSGFRGEQRVLAEEIRGHQVHLPPVRAGPDLALQDDVKRRNLPTPGDYRTGRVALALGPHRVQEQLLHVRGDHAERLDDVQHVGAQLSGSVDARAHDALERLDVDGKTPRHHRLHLPVLRRDPRRRLVGVLQRNLAEQTSPAQHERRDLSTRLVMPAVAKQRTLHDDVQIRDEILGFKGDVAGGPPHLPQLADDLLLRRLKHDGRVRGKHRERAVHDGPVRRAEHGGLNRGEVDVVHLPRERLHRLAPHLHVLRAVNLAAVQPRHALLHLRLDVNPPHLLILLRRRGRRGRTRCTRR